ncbi:MAG: S8/S53 family peptidase [Chloroherpetonaceae bacterium]|nr:S8/S53 family peptidase [Chloroherpetonaceae bacterium]
MKRSLFTVVALLCACVALAQSSKLSPDLTRRLQTLSEQDDVKVVVTLSRKASGNFRPEDLLSERAIKRRQKMVRAGVLPSVITVEDLPFEQADLRALEAAGLRIQHQLKGLFKVSGIIKKAQLPALEAIEAVSEIDAVKFFRRPPEIEETHSVAPIQQTPTTASTGSLNYGASFGQLNQINVPAVHALGYSGQGVLIANFDAGFSNLSHEAFQTMTIVARKDFVTGQNNVVAPHSHGTLTLSAVGGFKQGQLIGPAFSSLYALARTEDAASETPVEETNWAAAVEWADSLGADIITSSLGYLDFDPPFPSYTWQQMNGQTAISTLAARRAARLGIVVCNSAGNSGMVALPANTLGAPADADSILAVGAVTSSGVRASFSSVGPTADGRIKPDVMAQGVAVRAASASGNNYTNASGTSLSCPLIAGVAALVLSAHPNLTPMQVITAIKSTASNANAPNREIGWGIANALAAVNFYPLSASQPSLPKVFALHQNYPNPFNPTTTIAYQLAENADVALEVFDVLGRKIATLVEARQDAGSYSANFDASGLSSGVYFYRLRAGAFSETRKMILAK